MKQREAKTQRKEKSQVRNEVKARKQPEPEVLFLPDNAPLATDKEKADKSPNIEIAKEIITLDQAKRPHTVGKSARSEGRNRKSETTERRKEVTDSVSAEKAAQSTIEDAVEGKGKQTQSPTIIIAEAEVTQNLAPAEKESQVEETVSTNSENEKAPVAPAEVTESEKISVTETETEETVVTTKQHILRSKYTNIDIIVWCDRIISWLDDP